MQYQMKNLNLLDKVSVDRKDTKLWTLEFKFLNLYTLNCEMTLTSTGSFLL